jgi:tetratricopeptide (TPR) repeat protein
VKKIISLFVFICSLHISLAQANSNSTSQNIKTTGQLLTALSEAPNFDSLKKKAALDINSETRAITLFAITAQYLNINLDSSLKYIRQFNDVQGKSKLWIANGFVIIGDLYSRLGNTSMALENMLKGTKILKELNDSAGMGMAWWNLGKLYQSLDDPVTSKAYFFNSIKISVAAEANVPLRYSMGHLGHLYMDLNQPDSALYYTQSAYDLSGNDQNAYEPILLAQMGNIYQKMGNTSFARKFYRNAL